MTIFSLSLTSIGTYNPLPPLTLLHQLQFFLSLLQLYFSST
jgi:hypothetical protein